MTSRTKTKDTKAEAAADQTTKPQDAAKEETLALCGAVHTLPLLSHVTCQRPAGHTDEPPRGADRAKHHARAAGASYTW